MDIVQERLEREYGMAVDHYGRRQWVYQVQDARRHADGNREPVQAS